MKIYNLLFIIAFIATLVATLSVVYDDHINQTTWKTKEIQGYIKEFTLYNTFPNNAVYIGFTSGDYILVTENRFWTYTQLINLDTSIEVNITYKENNNRNILITKINAWYYNSQE